MKKKEIVLPVFPFFDGGRPAYTDFFAAAKMHHGDVNVVFQPDVASKAKPGRPRRTRRRTTGR